MEDLNKRDLKERKFLFLYQDFWDYFMTVIKILKITTYLHIRLTNIFHLKKDMSTLLCQLVVSGGFCLKNYHFVVWGLAVFEWGSISKDFRDSF